MPSLVVCSALLALWSPGVAAANAASDDDILKESCEQDDLSPFEVCNADNDHCGLELRQLRVQQLKVSSIANSDAETTAAPSEEAKGVLSCVLDVTSQYHGRYPCIVKNQCAKDLSVTCGGKSWAIEGNRGPHKPDDDALCGTGCTVTKDNREKVLHSDCFLDVTSKFHGTEQCTVSNNCPEDVVVNCGGKREYVPSDVGQFMRVASDVCSSNCTFSSPQPTRPSCLKDVTFVFPSESCMLLNECADTVFVRCPSKSSRYAILEPKKGATRPSSEFGGIMCTEPEACVYY